MPVVVARRRYVRATRAMVGADALPQCSWPYMAGLIDSPRAFVGWKDGAPEVRVMPRHPPPPGDVPGLARSIEYKCGPGTCFDGLGTITLFGQSALLALRNTIPFLLSKAELAAQIIEL